MVAEDVESSVDFFVVNCWTEFFGGRGRQEKKLLQHKKIDISTENPLTMDRPPPNPLSQLFVKTLGERTLPLCPLHYISEIDVRDIQACFPG